MRERNPEKIITKAVLGMIPKNRLKKFREEKLKVFAEADHHYKVEVATQPPSPLAVDIGANYRWLKNRDMTEIEAHILAYGIMHVGSLLALRPSWRLIYSAGGQQRPSE